MKALVQHLLRSNRAEILKRSLKNCHVLGVHSIMLLESPGKTIRLFVAEPGHVLGFNFPHLIQQNQTLAFHAHHCELTLCCTRGSFANITAAFPTGDGLQIGVYRHRSKIKKGAIGFTKLGKRAVVFSEQQVSAGQWIYMPAEQVHSVACDVSQWAAWLVFEGRENPAHDDLCWSFTPLEEQTFNAGLYYQPMPEPELFRLLQEAHLL